MSSTSSRQDNSILSLLRPSENLRIVLNVDLAAENASTPPNTRTESSDALSHQYNIVIVTHKNEVQNSEEGGFLVVKSGAANNVLRVDRAIPITEGLTLVVSQAKFATPESRQTEEDPRIPAETAWALTIKSGTQDTTPLSFVIRDGTQRLQSFTAEYRRLREIVGATHRSSFDFTWLRAYSSEPSSRTLDLRLRNQPLHSCLSPASAGNGDDASDISLVQREWIEQTATAQASNNSTKHLKIRIGSFNVNGKPPSQDLSPWLRSSVSQSQEKAAWISPLKLSPVELSSDPLHQEIGKNDTPVGAAEARDIGDPDLFVLGFQELDLSTEALLYATSTSKEDVWVTAIFAALGEKGVLYEKLASRQLVGMLLVVIVRKALVPCFSDVRLCDAGAGIMGFMGNKGAAAIRLEFTPKPPSDSLATRYRPTILTFVNAHLAAFDEMVDRRNYDFQELSGRLAFPPNGLNGNYAPDNVTGDVYSIYQSDILFWMVDLNYRLDLPDGDIRALLSSHVSGIESIQSLMAHDQLNIAIRTGKAFTGFSEHPITHIPTYRLATGVSKDRLGYDMKRKPAWTDRILYMSSPGMKLKQLAYRSHPEIVMSDHQPVSADFDISLAMIDGAQYEKSLLELHREFASFEDSGRMPKVKIHPTSVEFGNIVYKRSVRREVVVKNEADVPCVFRFVGAGADEPVTPSWLHVEPIVGLLRPHESATITLLAHIDNGSAAKLNLGPSRLEFTLILHTALGKDHFIAVSGDYQYTCFANTLERLTRLASPIRKLKSPEELMPPGKAINAPREVMRLINWMMTNVSATDELFEYPAKESLCNTIRECLDTGEEFPYTSPNEDHRELVAAFASTLVSFLDSLTEPLVPPYLHARCLQAKDKDEAFELLDEFPHECINVWISLTAFLHYIAQQSSKDHSPNTHRKAQKLAMILAPTLLRDDPTGVHPRVSPLGKIKFLLHFIG
ncbi:DNase I-like protein [Paxillus ammoniavirescens]|nr:DNase I-like protein [Paxillus ammoniavirescens]